ncbi:FAD-dependent oxidoreductase [Nocardia macrotermitis]|uniref:Nitric oxide reductase FlRd-NAD(+) reductase n=1 Tax=Nocardia macrotermitis TaxID=2585198 RepID=A0A7K0D3L0_9NOCA|nr:FAD-dependent oxidoreductase [Nocardia macrotermitis]MQY20323.1 Nitric oxide reductase FlRd-NAD(+) reductase [Nocardia macrotermitis]
MVDVVVIGGGFGGTAVAKALDDIAEVTVVEPRDAFVYNVAALRGLTDPAWTDRMFFPYDRLLRRGRVVRDRAVRVDASKIELASGERIDADFVVLATGSAYPFPAKTDDDQSLDAKARFHATRANLVAAERVLLLGAGAVGLELAGEIVAAWPGKAVTILDPSPEILGGGYHPDLRVEVRRQLAELGVELILGTGLRADPPSRAGELETFTVVTRSGEPITADTWFRCFGVRPITDYLAEELSAARGPDGYLEVTPELRVRGQDRVFALGDLVASAEGKTAKAAGLHADVVAANIRALIEGTDELREYRPGPEGIALPLGPHGGASYSPEVGVLGAEATARLKGADLRITAYREMFGLAAQ